MHITSCYISTLEQYIYYSGLVVMSAIEALTTFSDARYSTSEKTFY